MDWMKRSVAAAVAAMVLAGVTGCGNESGTAPQSSAGGVLPADLKLAAAPAGEAKTVSAFRAGVKDGERVVITGKIAGRKDPIGENRAILTLLDPGVKTCDQEPGDSCKTPWDACCEPPESLAKNSVAVQVADAAGNPVKASLKGVEGVKPLAKVIVSGTTRVLADGSVSVDADGIYVTQ